MADMQWGKKLAVQRATPAATNPILTVFTGNAARLQASARVAAAATATAEALLGHEQPGSSDRVEHPPPRLSAVKVVRQLPRAWFPALTTVDDVAARIKSCSIGLHGKCFRSCPIPRFSQQGVVVRTIEAPDIPLRNGDVLSSTIFIFVGPDGKQIMPRVGGSGQNAVKVVYGIAVDR